MNYLRSLRNIKQLSYCMKFPSVSRHNYLLLESKKYLSNFDFEDEEFDNDEMFNSSNNFNNNNNNFRFDLNNTNRNNNFKKTHIEWSKETLIPFKKDFYKEPESIKKKTNEEVMNFRKENGITVFGRNVPKPFDTWEESGIPSHCYSHIKRLGLTHPTPIQQQGIPMALSGNDVIGISRTGSGKTLAYLLPGIVHIHAQPLVKLGEGPISLILAPTRELVQQIDNEINKFVETNKNIQLKHCAVFGGADRHKQIYNLRQSPDIVVGTPGRLMDLLESNETNFKRLTYLVMDEADRMLDMGFRQDLEIILSYVRPDKQVLCWSATWPKEIQDISNKYMNNPIRVQIGSIDLHANSNIKQYFKVLEYSKLKLQQFIKDISQISNSGKKCLVFTNTKRDADYLENICNNNNINARSIHGDKTQTNRDNILKSFKSSRINVLIATNVVARGIDIHDISVVLNYDFPANVEDYVHRIGRTARGNDKGVSLSYCTQDDIERTGRDLYKVLIKSNQKIPKVLETFEPARKLRHK